MNENFLNQTWNSQSIFAVSPTWMKFLKFPHLVCYQFVVSVRRTSFFKCPTVEVIFLH